MKDSSGVGRAEAESILSSCLPHLLYVGDVPVESSYHGSALLFRLLQRYPACRLLVIENMFHSLPERRLPEVAYRGITVRSKRLLLTRLHKSVSFVLSLSATWQWRRIIGLLDGFQPEAVLTVAHGFSWMAAAAFAKRNSLPLHLIIHDDWPRIFSGIRPVRSSVDRQFKRCYREAASRLCASPSMVEKYERCYGAKGTVLYPSRAADVNVFDSPPERLCQTNAGLTAVFAGTVNTPGYVQTLNRLADSLQTLRGRLLIYGPLTREAAAASGLQRGNIELRGLVSSSELIERCRDEADVLFVPMSFAPEDRANMEIAFPSKLTDYTAMGLPLLIYGPDYSSAVRWANENPDVAEVVTDESPEALARALCTLQDPDRRIALAEAAIRRGHEYFDHRRAFNILRDALRNTDGE